MALAQHVWATMKSTDSRECRNCHAMASMDVEKQVRPAQRMHKAAIEKGQTCIDCHKGIAHKLPAGYVPD
jgi:nitrate/TMAO reductase-like tetraheme cytochrome c subunit